MRAPRALHAMASSLPDKQFWRDTIRQTIHLTGDPSSGLGIAVATAAMKSSSA